MDLLQAVSSTLSVSQSATYSCMLTNNWSMANHPVDYERVSGTAHWTPPVLASHSTSYEMWSPGSMATLGVENVAESGATATLLSEINVAQSKGFAGQFVLGNDQFNSRDPPQTFADITLLPDYPLLSTITMAGPSPDWFTGIYNFSPMDDTNQVWYESFKIASYPWDAGTEKGDTYSLNNEAENPHVPIFQLTKDTVPSNGILLDPSGTEILPVAVWECTLKNAPVPDRFLVKLEQLLYGWHY